MLIDFADRYSANGNITYNNGALGFGHAVFIAPLAYLHKIFPPLEGDVEQKVYDQVGVSPPTAYAEFLSQCNGANFFIATLGLNGVVGMVSRDPYAPTAFRLETDNRYEAPKNLPSDAIIIGGYSKDGSYVYIQPDGTVSYCKPRDATPLLQWDNLKTFLESELERLASIHDAEGRLLYDKSMKLPA